MICSILGYNNQANLGMLIFQFIVKYSHRCRFQFIPRLLTSFMGSLELTYTCVTRKELFSDRKKIEIRYTTVFNSRHQPVPVRFYSCLLCR